MLKAIFNDDCTELTVEGLSQWDKGRTLEIQYSDMPKFCKVNFGFANGRTSMPVYPKEIGGGAMLLDIPNSLISYSYDLIAYVYEIYPDGRQIATKVINLPIEKRPKPMDYIADDVSASEQLEAMLADIQECMATKAALKDAVVVNGEVRYPSEGLEYELNEEGESYKVVGLGTCTDINVVVPRTYNGKPVTAIGDNAFENAQIDSINLWECVTSIGKEAFKGCSPFRFVYIYSTTPITVGTDAFPETVQGYFVPLHSVDTYKADEGWTLYADKVVAIETAESINTFIVNVFNAAMANDANLGQLIQNLANNQTAFIDTDKFLQDQINELKPKYSEGLEYVVVNVNNTLGFGVSGIGTCTDTDIVIPPTYNGFPVLSLLGLGDGPKSLTIPESVKYIEYVGASNTLEVVTFLGAPPSGDLNLRDPSTGAIIGIKITFLPGSDVLKEIRVRADQVGNYRAWAKNRNHWHANPDFYAGDKLAKKIVAIETLETLRADIDAIKADLSESIAEIDTLIGGGE